MKWIVSEDLSQEAYESLLAFSQDFIFIRKSDRVYKGLGSHADLQCFPLSEDDVVVQPDIDPDTIGKMEELGLNVLYGRTKLCTRYPGDIPYNVAVVGDMVFHHLDYTDPLVKEQLQFRHKKFVHVKQGYAKCSILPLGDRSMITSDAGIAKTASQWGIEVLLIESGHIQLPGFNTGFIGGASGLVKEKGVVLFNGDINRHPDGKRICSYIKGMGLESVCLRGGPLIDIGSIYCLP